MIQVNHFIFVVYTKVLKKYFDDGIQQINDPALKNERDASR